MKKIAYLSLLWLLAFVMPSCTETEDETSMDPVKVLEGKYNGIQNVVVTDGANLKLPIKKTKPLGTVEVTVNTDASVWIGGGLRAGNLRWAQNGMDGVLFDIPEQLSFGNRTFGYEGVKTSDGYAAGYFARKSSALTVDYLMPITDYSEELDDLLANYTEAEWAELMGYIEMAAPGSGVTRETVKLALMAKFKYVLVQQIMKKL